MKTLGYHINTMDPKDTPYQYRHIHQHTWCIQYPDGYLDLRFMHPTEAGCVMAFLKYQYGCNSGEVDLDKWQAWLAHGYDLKLCRVFDVHQGFFSLAKKLIMMIWKG